MPAWLIPAITAAGSIAASALGKSRTKTLTDREQQLTDIQSDANKGMALYNQKLQMDMWEKTGPQGQMEQLNKAGLNPGLIYGMGGAGGQTANAAQAAPVGRSAANDRTKGDDMMSMGLATMAQIGLMNAQQKKTEAETQNIQADTHNKPLVGANLAADTTNKGLHADLQHIQNKIAGDTAENAIATVEIELQKRMQELEMQVRQNAISEETKNATIDRAKAEAQGAVLTNELIKAQTGQSKSTVEKNGAEIAKMAADIAQGWKKLSIEEQNAATQKFNAELHAKYPGITAVPGAMMAEIMNWTGQKISGGNRNEHTTVPKK